MGALLSPGIKKEEKGFKNINITEIDANINQPRKNFNKEELKELANSIKSNGILQPIIVRPSKNNRFEIIAGERRWRAAQIAGIHEIPSLIKEMNDETIQEVALIENIQRENLNPIEEAMALKRLQDEFDLTQQQVADSVGKSRATVTNLMRLIGLHIDVKKMLEKGDLEMGHARALLALPDLQQADAARTVVSRGLSVRQTESLARRLLASGDEGKSVRVIDPDIKNLEESLAEKLGTNVMVQHTAKGRGRLVIKYNNLDELDGILAHIS